MKNNQRVNLTRVEYNIDLLVLLEYDFLAAVRLLEGWLNKYQAQQAKRK